MSGSKVILVGAISIIFGLYTLSLTKVNSYAGNTAENSFYIAKAHTNAISGVNRSLNRLSRQYYDPNRSDALVEGSYTYYEYPSINFYSMSGWDFTNPQVVNISSHGYFLTSSDSIHLAQRLGTSIYGQTYGHHVIRTVQAKCYSIYDVQNYWDWKILSTKDSVDYFREHILDSLLTK